jgi:hypothetical protein
MYASAYRWRGPRAGGNVNRCCATPVGTCGFPAQSGLPVHPNRTRTSYSRRMIRQAGSVGPEDEALREHALEDLDSLIDAAADARRDLRSYQSVLEKNRRNLAQGGRASDISTRFDVRAVRTSLTERLDQVERARNSSRRSLWRLQLSEGTTIAEIARSWGISRQLVSRTLRSEAPQHHGSVSRRDPRGRM